MERNPTDNMGTSGAGASGVGTDSLSTGSENASFDSTNTSNGNDNGAGLADRVDSARATATNAMNQAKDVASERLGQAKEKASQLKSTLADRLDASANSLRQQAQGGQLVGAGADGSSAASGLLSNDQVQRLAGPAADAMQKTAQFLREGDLKEALEEQVRTNPARTLLIALGVGYLIGKAVRR